MKKICRYLLALPFMVLGTIFAFLWLFMAVTAHLLIYFVGFFYALKIFIVFGEWKLSEAIEKTFLELKL